MLKHIIYYIKNEIRWTYRIHDIIFSKRHQTYITYKKVTKTIETKAISEASKAINNEKQLTKQEAPKNKRKITEKSN